jgi:hypothetical protein
MNALFGVRQRIAHCFEDSWLIPTYQMAQKHPIHRHEEWYAMSWPQSTEGQKGMMVMTKAATYLPR